MIVNIIFQFFAFQSSLSASLCRASLTADSRVSSQAADSGKDIISGI